MSKYGPIIILGAGAAFAFACVTGKAYVRGLREHRKELDDARLHSEYPEPERPTYWGCIKKYVLDGDAGLV